MLGWTLQFGVAAALIAVAAYCFYIRAIIAGTTKPSAASWIAWSVVGVMIWRSYAVSGAEHSVYTTIIYSIFPPIIVYCSYRYRHEPVEFTRLDQIALSVSLLSAVVWAWLILYSPYRHSAAIVLYTNIVIDLAGGIATMKHGYIHPEQEDKTTWVLSTIATIVNVFAVEQWVPLKSWLTPATWLEKDFVICFYPVVLVGMCAMIVLIIFVKRPSPKQCFSFPR